MSNLSLEERVTALEQEVAQLKANGLPQMANGLPRKDWRRTVGMFTNDPEMQRLFETAMKLRESDRARARRASSRQRRTRT